MKNLGKITDPKDIITKEFLEEGIGTRVNTLEDNVAMAESDIETLQGDVQSLQTDNTATKAAVKTLQDTYVPNTRKINNKALDADITLTASDVGALPTTGGTLTGDLEVPNLKVLNQITTPIVIGNDDYFSVGKKKTDYDSVLNFITAPSETTDGSNVDVQLATFLGNIPMVDIGSYHNTLDKLIDISGFDMDGLLTTKDYVDGKTPFILTCDKDNTGEVVFDKTAGEFNEAINQNKPIVLYDPYKRMGDTNSVLYRHVGGYYFYTTYIIIEQDIFKETKSVKMYLSWVFLKESNGSIVLNETTEIGAHGTHEYRIVENPASVVTFTNVTVPTSAWVANTNSQAVNQEKTDYPFMATISLTGVSANQMATVLFNYDDQIGGNFAPCAYTTSGGVIIEAKEKPTATITLASVTIMNVDVK